MVQGTFSPTSAGTAAPQDDDPGWLTLVEMCRARAAGEPDRRYFSFLENGVEESDSLTPAQVDLRARAIAVELLRVAKPGDRVLLNYGPGLDFVPAFFGALYAGMIAVPIPPVETGRDGAKTDRLEAVLASARPALFLSTTGVLEKLAGSEQVGRALAGVRQLATDTVDTAVAGEWREPDIDRDTVAYLQYSSGSTGLPKGVMLTHANVLDNLALIHTNGARGDLEEGQTPPPVVLWLPLFHDMGLVNAVFQPLYAGFEATLMPPLAFVQHPFNWLRAISDRGDAISVAPNFAYELCVRRIGEEQIAKLDLSGWRLAAVGAEPVRPETLERFAEKFAPAGFRRATFFPCYGLAESTVMVSGGPAPEEPVIRSFDAAALVAGRVRPATEGARARQLVGCGQIQPSLTLRIVDPATGEPCADDAIGEVYVSGYSVGSGYWDAPAITEETFRARLPQDPDLVFLRTGDLGFLYDGQLFITGRRKDVIILDGLNYYPHDIEATVSGSHPALRQDRCAAFSVDDGGQEKLVVLAEVQRRHPVVRGPVAEGTELPRNSVRAGELEAAIRRAVTAEHGVRVSEVGLLRPGVLPYTSSAKIKRAECRERWSAGTFDADHLA
ncbi:fatty acyl-AMP ligase [Streptomyces carpaticus]|uniref:fatty acyl-AMP ligase n=1 Tax=Streptomyces carpaticus TaxID=285558 RepID=UPI0031F90F4E